MNCDHCLIGEAQDKDIDTETIDTILNTFESIWAVQFHGGEPTLNLDAIEYFFEQAVKLNKMPSFFAVITNGKAHQKELADILLKYYPYCKEKQMCSVIISKDRFHEKIEDNFLESLPFYQDDRNKLDFDDKEWVRSMGRARNNKSIEVAYEKEPNKKLDVIIFPQNEEFVIDFDSMYITTDGWVLADTEHSYDDEKICKIFHINDINEFVNEKMNKENTDIRY